MHFDRAHEDHVRTAGGGPVADLAPKIDIYALPFAGSGSLAMGKAGEVYYCGFVGQAQRPGRARRREHLMALGTQAPAQRRADETASAGNGDFHRREPSTCW